MGQIGAGNVGSAYPGALDTLLYATGGGKSNFLNSTTPIADSQRRLDAEAINDVIDAIIAIETELGTAPSGSYATVTARFAEAVRTTGSSIDNVVAKWSGTSGTLIDQSGVLIDDSNNIIIGTNSAGTGLINGLVLYWTGSNVPSTSPTDSVQLYPNEQAAGVVGLGITGESGTQHLIARQIILGSQVPSTNVTKGVIIDMGTNADNILELRQTNVAHGMTTIVETSVFGKAEQVSTGVGGLRITGLSESSQGIQVVGYVTTATSLKTTSAQGAIGLVASKKSGTTVGAMGAGENIVIMRDGGSMLTKWVLDSSGDTWQSGGITLEGSIVINDDAATQWITTARRSTSNLAGRDFTVFIGGATVGATNKTGGNIALWSGVGTGNAKPSCVTMVCPAFKGVSGTADQTLVTRGYYNGTIDLTSGVNAALATIPLATKENAGGSLEYTIDVGDGTDVINLSSRISYAALNKGGVYTSTVISSTQAIAKSDAGHGITATFNFLSGTNEITLRVLATITTMTPTYIKMVYHAYSGAQQNVVYT